jgi:hypothetical protein
MRSCESSHNVCTTDFASFHYCFTNGRNVAATSHTAYWTCVQREGRRSLEPPMLVLRRERRAGVCAPTLAPETRAPGLGWSRRACRRVKRSRSPFARAVGTLPCSAHISCVTSEQARMSSREAGPLQAVFDACTRRSSARHARAICACDRRLIGLCSRYAWLWSWRSAPAADKRSSPHLSGPHSASVAALRASRCNWHATRAARELPSDLRASLQSAISAYSSAKWYDFPALRARKPLRTNATNTSRGSCPTPTARPARCSPAIPGASPRESAARCDRRARS